MSATNETISSGQEETTEEDEQHYLPEYDCPKIDLTPQKSPDHQLAIVACG